MRKSERESEDEHSKARKSVRKQSKAMESILCWDHGVSSGALLKTDTLEVSQGYHKPLIAFTVISLKKDRINSLYSLFHLSLERQNNLYTQSFYELYKQSSVASSSVGDLGI